MASKWSSQDDISLMHALYVRGVEVGVIAAELGRSAASCERRRVALERSLGSRPPARERGPRGGVRRRDDVARRTTRVLRRMFPDGRCPECTRVIGTGQDSLGQWVIQYPTPVCRECYDSRFKS